MRGELPVPKAIARMKRVWPIIGVRDVPRSFEWYQSLLGVTPTAPAHDDFGQILDADGTVLICLHQWGAHDHPSLTSPDGAESGNGLLLFFRVDDFDRALAESTDSRHASRRRAPAQPEHGNFRVGAPGSRRGLRYDQRPFSVVT